VVAAAAVALLESAPFHLGHSRLFAVAENKMRAFIKRFLLQFVARRSALTRTVIGLEPMLAAVAKEWQRGGTAEG
jgi:hypothetical protein